MRTIRHDRETLTQIAINYASPIQREKVQAMLGMGWQISKVASYGEKSAVFLNAKTGAVAAVLPCGKVERPDHGKSRVTVNLRTMEKK